MSKQDPISQKIQEQEAKIKEEVQLKRQPKRLSLPIIITSIILLAGVIIGLVRIIMNYGH